MNISLVPAECNKVNTIFCPLTPEEFEIFRKEGLIAGKTRAYRMVLYHHEIQIECPVLMDGNRAVGVILPAFKLPYRPYPCYVYLFAIALYLVGDSMRKAARKVQKKFGIPGFSHSTISRTWSILLSKTDLLSAVTEPYTSGKSLPGHSAFKDREAWTQEKKNAAFQLFKSLCPLLASPEAGMWLVYRYFMCYCCFLI
jgi:hypothetical protein